MKERELEKVNRSYLHKEADVRRLPELLSKSNCLQLKIRLKTLQDKKRMIQSSSPNSSQISASFFNLHERFQQFHSDLTKLEVNGVTKLQFIETHWMQQFVDLNATAFSKILKKVLRIYTDLE